MKKISLVISLFYLSLLSSQENKEYILNLKASHAKAAIVSRDTQAWAGKAFSFRVRTYPYRKNIQVTVNGNLVNGVDNFYTTYIKPCRYALITVAEKLPDKKINVLCCKTYPVSSLPEPVVSIRDVKKDSVIDNRNLLSENKIEVYSTFYKIPLPVLSFDMLYLNNDTFDTLRTSRQLFSPAMRRELFKLKDGSMLFLQNIRCRMPDGEIKAIESFQVYITEAPTIGG